MRISTIEQVDGGIGCETQYPRLLTGKTAVMTTESNEVSYPEEQD